MLTTRVSGKVTTRETLANTTKSIRCLKHTLLGQATRKAMLEIYYCVTSASFTTLACVRQNVAIASGWVIKQEIETMTTVNQRMSIEEIERVVAQRVANAIETIAIYEAKTNLTRKSMSQTKRQEEEVAENDSNKKK
nr:hypothetical protein [Tanacetum cinerariifolium]